MYCSIDVFSSDASLPGKEASEEKASIEKYKKEYADYWKEIIGVDGDFDLKAEKEEVE